MVEAEEKGKVDGWVAGEGGHGHVIHALSKLSAYLLWENVRESFQVSSPFS